MQGQLTRWMAAIALVLGACSGEDDPPPVDAPCGEPRIVVTDDATLAAALDEATAGTCIVLREGTYQGPVVVDTDGVTLAAATGETVVVRGAEGGTAIRVTADGVTVIDVDTEGGDYGLLSTGRRGKFDAMELKAALEAAVGIRCEDQDCLDVAQRTELLDLLVAESGFGIGIWGGNVLIDGSTIRDNTSDGLSGGGGLYVMLGADVLIRNSNLERNLYGLVGDGAATRVTIEGGTIADNGDGGVRAQDMQGDGRPSVDDPRGHARRAQRYRRHRDGRCRRRGDRLGHGSRHGAQTNLGQRDDARRRRRRYRPVRRHGEHDGPVGHAVRQRAGKRGHR